MRTPIPRMFQFPLVLFVVTTGHGVKGERTNNFQALPRAMRVNFFVILSTLTIKNMPRVQRFVPQILKSKGPDNISSYFI